jgi:hypothetical protein
MTADIKKSKKLALEYKHAKPEIYTVLLATCPSCGKDKKNGYDSVIKYSPATRKEKDRKEKASERLGEDYKGDVSENVRTMWKKKFNDEMIFLEEGEFKGGEAFNIKTDVLYWIFKAQ